MQLLLSDEQKNGEQFSFASCLGLFFLYLHISSRDYMYVVSTEMKDTRHLQIDASVQVVKAFIASA